MDIAGHEIAEQRQTAHGWQLRGVAVFAHEERPCRLEYDIRCDQNWQTELVTLGGNVGEKTIAMELLRNPAGEWSMHGSKVWELTDCDDIDLNFSHCGLRTNCNRRSTTESGLRTKRETAGASESALSRRSSMAVSPEAAMST